MTERGIMKMETHTAMVAQEDYEDVFSFANQPNHLSESCGDGGWDYYFPELVYEEETTTHHISLVDMVLSDPLYTSLDLPNHTLLQEGLAYDLERCEVYGCHQVCDDVHVKNKTTEIAMSEKINGAERLSREAISDYFYMPITEAAKELKVSLTHLKKRCRKLGIPRWPCRKLISLQTLINNLKEMEEDEMIGGKERVREALEILEREKRMIEENPCMELQHQTKRLRQTCFKSKYNRRKLARD